MRKYQHLIGRPFVWGRQDCYGLVRDFYNDVFDIQIPDYARPEDFYLTGLDLFRELYRDAGFKEIDVHPSEYKFGDVALSAIDSPFGNHCSIFVENGRIIHHLHGGLSRGPDFFRGLVRNTCVGIYRHKEVPENVTTEVETSDLREFLSPKKQQVLDKLRSSHSGTQNKTD